MKNIEILELLIALFDLVCLFCGCNGVSSATAGLGISAIFCDSEYCLGEQYNNLNYKRALAHTRQIFSFEQDYVYLFVFFKIFLLFYYM